MAVAKRKTQQWIIMGGIAGILAVSLVGVNMVMQKSRANLMPKSVLGSMDETIIADRTSHASPEMSWITQSTQAIEDLNKELEVLRRERQQETAAAKEARELMLDEFSDALVAMQGQINELKSAPTASSALQAPTDGSMGEISLAAATPGGPNRLSGTDFISQRSLQARRNSPFTKPVISPDRARGGSAQAQTGAQAPSFGVEFTLSERARDGETARRKVLGSYLPAGSYAPAVVISGVDASTGVVSQDNPVPVTLRITGPATTAGHGTTRGAKVNIKGCMIIGSARGDLSSERVYVRLDKMTCIRGNAVFEADVAGYMSGSGKAGARGRVVSREGNLVRKAAIAGALQGLAGAFEGAGAQGAELDGAEVSDLFRSAGMASIAGGTANAASTLADYYIQRAEQY